MWNLRLVISNLDFNKMFEAREKCLRLAHCNTYWPTIGFDLVKIRHSSNIFFLFIVGTFKRSGEINWLIEYFVKVNFCLAGTVEGGICNIDSICNLILVTCYNLDLSYHHFLFRFQIWTFQFFEFGFVK